MTKPKIRTETKRTGMFVRETSYPENEEGVVELLNSFPTLHELLSDIERFCLAVMDEHEIEDWYSLTLEEDAPPILRDAQKALFEIKGVRDSLARYESKEKSCKTDDELEIARNERRLVESNLYSALMIGRFVTMAEVRGFEPRVLRDVKSQNRRKEGHIAAYGTEEEREERSRRMQKLVNRYYEEKPSRTYEKICQLVAEELTTDERGVSPSTVRRYTSNPKK